MVTWFIDLRTLYEEIMFLFSLEKKIIIRYKLIGYVMREPVCLVFNPIMVDDCIAFFNCTPVRRVSDSMMALT